MLKIRKSINANGEITIDNTTVVSLNAYIEDNTEGYNITSSILNKELYKANKETVRAEMDEFEDYVDSLVNA